MRVIFAGTPEVALPSFERLLASEHEVVGVLTRPDARRGRGRTVYPSPVAERSRALGVPTFTPSSLRDDEAAQILEDLAPDVVAVVAYGALVPPGLLDVPRHGWVNLHFSLLPAWRGAAPVQHAIMAGDDLTGASTFRIEAGLDTGPVYGTLTERIQPRDTAGELLERLATHGAGLLEATLGALDAGDAVGVPQPTDGVSLAPRLSTADAQVSWHLPALAIDRRVRGLTPAPGAWTTFRGQRLRFGPVELVADASPLPAGVVRAEGQRVLVGTGTSPVALTTVVPAGRGEMTASAWARGARLDDDSRLGENE